MILYPCQKEVQGYLETNDALVEEIAANDISKTLNGKLCPS